MLWGPEPLTEQSRRQLWLYGFSPASVPLSFPQKWGPRSRYGCQHMPVSCSWLCICPEECENTPGFGNVNLTIAVMHCSGSENASPSLVRAQKPTSTDSSSVSWALPAGNTQPLVATREPGPLASQVMDRRLVLHRNCESEFRSSCITLTKCCSSFGKWG